MKPPDLEMKVQRVSRNVPGSAAVALWVALALGCSGSEAESNLMQAGEAYFPTPGESWRVVSPESVGMHTELLEEAVEFAIDNESEFGPDLEASLSARLATSAYPELLGPMKSRGGANGIIVKDGFIVAEWGDTDRVDMTFSVTKSVLATLAGLALDRGLIRDVSDPISEYVPTDSGLFEGEHNGKITWEMLLQQRSEWEGTLWGKPDVADRRRGADRELQEPGTFWEYNDVRVNLAALSLLHVWGRPLPEVLTEEVMDPIGASPDWEYHGYDESSVEVAGRMMHSVSGGGHWGGGLWIGSRDLARLGYLYLRDGQWEDEAILSQGWVREATTPTEIQPNYGFMIWLNTEQQQYASAPGSSFFFLGGGSNVVWIDPDHDLVAVVRWIEGSAVDGFIERVLAAVER